MKHFEENFEKENGYKVCSFNIFLNNSLLFLQTTAHFSFTNLFFQPSLADKASKPTVKKWMNDISKAKREIKSKRIISICM